MSNRREHKVVQILYIVFLVLASLILISPFYIPLIFGATISLALYPLLLKLESKGLPRKRAAGLITFLFTIIISIPFCFFLVKGTIAVTQQLEKIHRNERLREQGMTEIVSNIREDVVGYVQKYAEKFGFLDFLTPKKIDFYLDTVTTFLLKFFRDFAYSLPALFMFLLIMILCIYFMLKFATSIRAFFQEITGFEDRSMDKLIRIFIRNSRQVYMSNIVTGGVQSLMVATGVSFLGYGDFFLVFFVTLILSFIPVIGAAPVAFIFAVVAFLKDSNAHAIILAVLGGFTGLVDNILRPWLASFGESRIQPAVSFVCVIGGAFILGFPGLFIGLLVGTMAYDTLPLFWKKLSSEKNSE